MATSKHLHNILKIAPTSEFTCRRTLDMLSKPHFSLRPQDFSPYPCPSSSHQDKLWLRGREGQKKILSVTTPLTNFLKLPLINKTPVGVAAQGKPRAIFQLVSPERQIGILHSTLRTESEKKNRGGKEMRGMREDKNVLCWRAHCKGKEERGRDRRHTKRRTVKDAEAGISFLWGDQIKWLWQQFGQNNVHSRDRQIDSGPRPVSENSHSLCRPLEGNVETDRAPARQYQLTAACFVCWSCVWNPTVLYQVLSAF